MTRFAHVCRLASDDTVWTIRTPIFVREQKKFGRSGNLSTGVLQEVVPYTVDPYTGVQYIVTGRALTIDSSRLEST